MAIWSTEDEQEKRHLRHELEESNEQIRQELFPGSSIYIATRSLVGRVSKMINIVYRGRIVSAKGMLDEDWITCGRSSLQGIVLLDELLLLHELRPCTLVSLYLLLREELRSCCILEEGPGDKGRQLLKAPK